MFEQGNYTVNQAVIKVVGIGGGGCNAINSMIDSSVGSAEFISVNTDNQALLLSKAERTLQIGAKLTKGLGAGSNPDVGEAAAEESKDEVAEILKGTDLLFIAAGMGGGTGTGAASVVARIAKEQGILTVAVVTKPFSFEGRVRNENASKGIANLRKYVDTLIIIPNDKLLEFLPAQTGMLDAFKVADDMLKQGIIGIVDLIATPSLINLDFADVDTVMRNQGLAHMGLGRAKGENRVIEAVRQAVSSPLLETTIEGAKSVILNVTGGKDLMLGEVSEAANLIQGIIDESANIIFGATIDESMSEEIKITVIATGFLPDNESRVNKSAVKPAIGVAGEVPSDSNLPPLLREIEEEERRSKAAAMEAITAPRPTEIVSAPAEPIAPVVAPAPEQPAEEEPVMPEHEQKGKTLPLFMQKLFRKSK